VADPVTAGIDVSKTHLDVAARPGDPFRVGNDPDGIADLVARLRRLAPALVVLEATGGYEAETLAALLAAGIPAAVVNPRQVRQFAAGVGRHAKTDPIDAAVLAHFAAVVGPPPAAPADPARADLAALLDRRRQLLGMRVAEGNRVRPGLPVTVREGIAAHLAWLGEQIAALDAAVAAAVRRTPAWRERDRLLRSIKGVGPVVSRTLLADLPELGALPPAKLVALAGLAPFAADSGRKRGERHIRGGRREVRRALYMGALAVARVPGPLRDFAQRLKGKGKPSKVALIAVARKLLRIANAVIRDGRAWEEKPAAAA
jgi:transposase